MTFKEALSYDDVLLVPQFSNAETRSKIDTSVEMPNGFKFTHPIIPANMKTICGKEMAKFIAETGGLAFLHRFMSLAEQIEIVNEFVALSTDTFDYMKHIGVSVGVKPEDKMAVVAFIDAGVKIICVDIAHGDSKLAVEMVRFIKSVSQTVLIVAGNVATANGTERLWEAGAHVVKAGVGPGSLCSTRVETGNGVPQLTAIMEVAERALERRYRRAQCYHFIADGGIKTPGDCVKALCFADMVMCGAAFSGTDETPGEVFASDGRMFKSYDGSSTHKTNRIEGVRSEVSYKGPAKNILQKFLEGIQSGCSYQGCSGVSELKDSPQFVRITSAGLKESHPHIIGTIK